MITAKEAREIAAKIKESERARRKKEEEKLLTELLELRLAEVDAAVRQRMNEGQEEAKFEWPFEEFPQALRDPFERAVIEAGFGIEFHPNDNGDGWEVIINWRAK